MLTKIVLVISGLIMVISFGIAVLNNNYEMPITVGAVSGIIWLIADLAVAISAIRELARSKK